MEERYIAIKRFLDAANDLVTCKYAEAETQIKEVLKKIAASKELTELFVAVTQKFDYSAARRTYLRFPAAKGVSHGSAYLPSERQEILAFVFCLLVEIDAGTLPLSDTLLRYFYVDGSYTASWFVFSDRVIRPFRDIVRDCFPEASRQRERGKQEQGQATFDRFATVLSEEFVRVSALSLKEEESAAANVILSELSNAVAKKDGTEVFALLTGYRYLLRAFGGEDAQSEKLFSIAADL